MTCNVPITTADFVEVNVGDIVWRVIGARINRRKVTRVDVTSWRDWIGASLYSTRRKAIEAAIADATSDLLVARHTAKNAEKTIHRLSAMLKETR